MPWVTRKRVIAGLLALVGVPLLSIGVALATVVFLDTSSGTVVSGGEAREYLLHVPDSYDASRPAPLVISLHGAGMWPAYQSTTSRWNDAADEHGFIVVYPAGRGFGPKAWASHPGPGLVADVAFIDDLIDALQQTYNIDENRIYANGLSLGGGMSFALSCVLSDRVAAVGSVAGAQTLPWSWCTDARPVPMIAFHGTADPMVPYDGGPSPDPFNPLVFPSLPNWVASFARRNGCAESPTEAIIAEQVNRVSYSGCTDGADVVFYSVQGGGHTWPGGEPLPRWLTGETSAHVDATARMWAFFRDHPR